MPARSSRPDAPELSIGMVGYAFMGAAHSWAWATVAQAFDVPLRPRMAVRGGRPGTCWAGSTRSSTRPATCSPTLRPATTRNRRSTNGTARSSRAASGRTATPKGYGSGAAAEMADTAGAAAAFGVDTVAAHRA